MSAPFRAVGTIVKAHGLKGEVSVAPAADLPFLLSEGLHVWLVPPPAGVRDCLIESVRPGPKGPLVKLTGIDDPNVAVSLRGVELCVSADTLPPDLARPPFDPVGLRVVTLSGVELGRVEDSIETGANDVWVVRGDAHGEVLLPVIDDVVLDIDETHRVAQFFEMRAA